MYEPLEFRPIGHIETDVADADVPRQRRTMESSVVIAHEYQDALLGIDAYSHLFVLFWMHRAVTDETLTCHPRGNDALPLTGVLAARGRNHPNPIGLAVVELLDVAGNRLRVRRLDAFNGTPVVDIKPYDDYDVVHDPTVPDWFRAPRR